MITEINNWKMKIPPVHFSEMESVSADLVSPTKMKTMKNRAAAGLLPSFGCKS